MGAKLLFYFEQAKDMGSIKATMRLAMMTKITSKTAALVPDSPENIKKFEMALKEIAKEYLGEYNVRF